MYVCMYVIMKTINVHSFSKRGKARKASTLFEKQL